MHAREKGRGEDKEQRSHERNRGLPAAEQATRAGKGARQAHVEHNTAPKHRRGRHQRDQRKAAPRTTTRTAQTGHTPHTATPAPTACGQRAPAARQEGGQPGEEERLTPDLTTADGNPPGDALPPPPRRATPARKGARRGAGAGSPRPHRRTRDTQVAEPRLPAPEDGRPGEGQRLTPDAPHNSGRPPPRGTAPHHARGTQPRHGMQTKGTVLGPHTHTPAPTARGWRTRTARPVSGQSGEGRRLTSDAPHNCGRHPPRGSPSATPTASNAGLQGRTLWGRCWVPKPASTTPGTHGSRNPGCPLQRTGGRGRDSA